MKIAIIDVATGTESGASLYRRSYGADHKTPRSVCITTPQVAWWKCTLVNNAVGPLHFARHCASNGSITSYYVSWKWDMHNCFDADRLQCQITNDQIEFQCSDQAWFLTYFIKTVSIFTDSGKWVAHCEGRGVFDVYWTNTNARRYETFWNEWYFQLFSPKYRLSIVTDNTIRSSLCS